MLGYIASKVLETIDSSEFSEYLLAGLTVARSQLHACNAFGDSDDSWAVQVLLYLAEASKCPIPSCLVPFALPSTLSTVKQAILNIQSFARYPILINTYIKLLVLQLTLLGSPEDVDEAKRSLAEAAVEDETLALVTGLSRLLDCCYKPSKKPGFLETVLLTKALTVKKSEGEETILRAFDVFAGNKVKSATYAQLIIANKLLNLEAVHAEITERCKFTEVIKNYENLVESNQKIDPLLLIQKARIPTNTPVDTWMTATEKAADLEVAKYRGPRLAAEGEKILLDLNSSTGRRALGVLLVSQDEAHVFTVGEEMIQRGDYVSAAEVFGNLLALGDKFDIWNCVRKYQTCTALAVPEVENSPFIRLVENEVKVGRMSALPPRTLVVCVEVVGGRLFVACEQTNEVHSIRPINFANEYVNLKKFLTEAKSLSSLSEISVSIHEIFRIAWASIAEYDLVKSASDAAPVDVVLCLGKELFDYPLELDIVSVPGLRVVRDISPDFFLARLVRYNSLPTRNSKIWPVIKKSQVSLIADFNDGSEFAETIAAGLSCRILSQASNTPVSSGDIQAAFWGCEVAAVLAVDSNPSIQFVSKCLSDARVGSPHVALLSSSLIQDPLQGKNPARYSVHNSLYTLILRTCCAGFGAVLTDVVKTDLEKARKVTAQALEAVKEGKVWGTAWNSGANVLVGLPWLAIEPEGKAKK